MQAAEPAQSASFPATQPEPDGLHRPSSAQSVLVRQTGGWNLPRITEGLPYFDRSAVPGRLIFELRRVNSPAGVVLDSNGQPEGIVTIERVVDGILGYTSGN